MPRLSKYLAKLEDRLEKRFGKLYDRHKGKLKYYVPVGLCGLYFYGMLINSVRLGIDATFGEAPVEGIWVANPILNLLAVFTPTGLAVTAVGVLLFCLITKKGYIFFSGYKFKHDPRGFDILPDGTHGTSGFLAKKEMEKLLQVGPIGAVSATLLGKRKDRPEDGDKYADYVGMQNIPGLNNNILVFGAPGSGKSRGFVLPFAMQCVKRRESIFLMDAKSELYGKLAGFFRDSGYEVRVFNLLNMDHSDGWNCLAGLEDDPIAVQTVANIIIHNTNGPTEANDFWSRAELNLLEALPYYVCLRTPEGGGGLLPVNERALGVVYRLLATHTVEEINELLSNLPPDHPARAPHNNFLHAKENLWGNIVIGLGNRLAVFQVELVDRITRENDIDLLLPGQKPCAYFCIVSAQDSTFRFLSSLFITMAVTRLSQYAQSEGPDGRLSVPVNFCLDEYCNIGYLDGMSEFLASCRGFNINIQCIVQSLAQYQFRYPRQEWETQEANFDLMIYLGCNDETTAKFISARCGMVTITVTNNQMPLMPLFSPVYTSTRPYSQTRSNTQRELMQKDEVLRLPRDECLVLVRGEKPMRLYKLTPEEHPSFQALRPGSVLDYEPVWAKQKPATPPRQPETRETPSPAPIVPEPRRESAHNRYAVHQEQPQKPMEPPPEGIAKVLRRDPAEVDPGGIWDDVQRP